MPVRVTRGARTQWAEAPLNMRLRTDATEEVIDDVVDALNRRLPALAVPDADFARVDAPLPLPDGFGLTVHLWDASPAVCAALVDEVVAVLDEHDVDGRLGAMTGEHPPETPGPSIAAVAVVALRSDGSGLDRLDTTAVADALDWTIDHADGDVALWVRRAHLVVPAVAARELADQAVGRRDRLHVFARHGDDSRRMQINAGDGHHDATHVAVILQGGTPAADLCGAFETMVERARLVGEGADWTYVECRIDEYAGARAGSPFWVQTPDPGEASTVLVERVLEAHPWQRLTPAQAARLPGDLGDGAVFDAASGELRLGSVTGWLRGRPWSTHARMVGRMRRVLGPLLASRADVWEQAEGGEPPPSDVLTAPLVGWASWHPSLGVRPEELVGLRRGLPFGLAPELEVSGPVLRWIEHLGISGDPGAAEWLREPLLRLADSPATRPERHALHRFALVRWVHGTLASEVVDVAGLQGAETLRRVGELETGASPMALVGAALEVLAASGCTVEEQTQLQNEGDDRARHVGLMVRSAAAAAGEAACEQRPALHFWGSAWSTAHRELSTARMEGPIGAETAKRIYMAGARSQAAGVFYDAFEVATRLVPERVHEWQAIGRVVGDRAEVGGVTALTGDPATAWDRGVAAIRAQVPRRWDDAEILLTEALGTDIVTEAWGKARKYLARATRTTTSAVVYAAVVAPAEALIDLGSGLAQRHGRTDELQAVLRAAVDDLVVALTDP